MNEKQLHILQHSRGVDQYGRGTYYRNHFVTGPGSDDYADCTVLVALGLMHDAGPNMMCGGDHVFYVTKEGDKAIATESPKPPKLSRSQRRYREWFDADCGMPFGEWIKRKRLT